MVHFSPSPSPLPPTTMNGGAAADRLLLLASITEKDQQQQVTTVEEESSEEHTSDVVVKTNIAAVEDEQGSGTKARPIDKASNSTSIKRKSHEEPNADDDNNSVLQPAVVDPTTFKLNEDEDLMVQLHRSGLDQVKIPPLRQTWEIEEMVQNGKLSSYSSSLHSSAPAANKKKRKISDAGLHPPAATKASSPPFAMLDSTSRRMLNPSNYAALFPTYPTGHYLNNSNVDNGRVYGVGIASTNRGYGVLGGEGGGAVAPRGKSSPWLPNIVTGGSSPRSAALLRLNREEEAVNKANMMKRLSGGILPAPPFISGGVGGVVRSVSHGNAGGRTTTASSRALGHDYHKEIMSMSMAGLSQTHRMYYNMMNQPSPRLGPLLVQQQSTTRDNEKKKKMMNVNPTPSTAAAAAASVESEDDPQKNKTKEKKKLMIKHQLLLPAGQQIGAASPSPSPSPQDQEDDSPQDQEGDSPQDQEDDCSPTITTNTTATKKDDGRLPPSVAIFPNQEIFSQILREKQLKSRPSVPPHPPPLPAAAAATAAARANESESAVNDWDGQMTCLPVERDRVPVPSSSSSLPKSKSSSRKKSSDEAGGALPASSLSKSKSTRKEESSSSSRNVGAAYEAEARRRLQIEVMLRQQQERNLIEALPEYSTAARMLMWQQYNDEQMMMNPSSSLPLPLPSQLKPHHQSSDQVKLSLLELENQVRSEEHYARICSQNTRRMMELHHQASQLEQEMKLRELEFMRERRRLEDIQAVNRLRLQADALEQRLLMYGGGNGDDFDGVGRKK